MSAPITDPNAIGCSARSSSPVAQSLVESHFAVGDGVSPTSVSGAQTTAERQGSAGTTDGLLMFYAEGLDDLEAARIAFENRARSVAQAVGPELAERQQAMATQLKALEHQATLELKRAMRAHPLGPWVKQTIGVGEKQAARLLAAIGDPAWNSLYDRPRKLRELYAFCGLHVLDRPRASPPSKNLAAGQGSATTAQSTRASQGLSGGVAPSRTKGQKSNWSNTAKMRVYVIAESCLKAKARSPYGPIYDQGRAKYADALHSDECRRCGPKGKPALPGSPLSAGHQHARAMRLVMKAVLRDIWFAARDAHGVLDCQNVNDARAASSPTPDAHLLLASQTNHGVGVGEV